MKLLNILLFLSVFRLSAQEVKLGIKTSGIYKIDAAFIKKYAPELTHVPPENLRIRGGHPYTLPQENATSRLQGWAPIPAQVVRSENQWTLFFYGLGAEANPYSALNFYFLSESPDNKPLPLNTDKSKGTAATALAYKLRVEEDKTNLLQSGRLWLGDFIKSSYTLEHDYSHYQDNFRLKARFYPLGISRQFMDTRWGTALRRDTLLGAPYHPSSARYERVSNAHDLALDGAPGPVRLQLSAESVGNAGVYLDFWEVSYRRKLGLTSGQVHYELGEHAGPVAWPSSDKNLRFWQWYSPWEAEELRLDEAQLLHPRARESLLLAFVPEDILAPQFLGKVTFPNLLPSPAPELLVVFPEDFRTEAQQLIQYKREKEGMDILGVSTQAIYLQFSSGKVDPTAIRDFCRALYTENPNKFKALLLLGDASFDYRNILGAEYVKTENLVPTYASTESLEPIYSYASDDYFGFLEEHEGEWPEGYSVRNQWQSTPSRDHSLDIAVGRIPARSRAELAQYVQKYMEYRPGEWARELAFVADNRDYNLHQQDARSLEELALQNFPGYRTRSLYLDAFPVQNAQSPEATAYLQRLIAEGTFLLTYIGHGAEDGWTNEKLLSMADIASMKNEGRLPIFLTATCAFGRFDAPGKVSGAELLLLKPMGGAIALLSTTRPVYSSTNQVLNQAFFTHLSRSTTLGEAFRKTKNDAIRGEINRNFSLLGDPTLPLPRFDGQLDVKVSQDELHTLEELQLGGSTAAIQEGWAELLVLDAPEPKKTLGTFEDGPVFTYVDRSEILVKSRFPIQNFKWQGKISLPLNHRPGKGRLLLRLVNEEQQWFYGKELSFLPLGTAPGGLPGPVLSADTPNSDGITLHLRDEQGLSVKGLQLSIDDKVILNPLVYYRPENENLRASLVLPTALLPDGKFTVTLIAADIYNNVSLKTFPFEINREKFSISEVLAYPNPAVDLLNFRVSHNRQGDDLEGYIRIFDAQGREKTKVPLQCTSCKEEVKWSIDVQQLGISGEKGYYELQLKSVSSGSFEKSGGILFFWK